MRGFKKLGACNVETADRDRQDGARAPVDGRGPCARGRWTDRVGVGRREGAARAAPAGTPRQRSRAARLLFAHDPFAAPPRNQELGQAIRLPQRRDAPLRRAGRAPRHATRAASGAQRSLERVRHRVGRLPRAHRHYLLDALRGGPAGPHGLEKQPRRRHSRHRVHVRLEGGAPRRARLAAQARLCDDQRRVLRSRAGRAPAHRQAHLLRGGPIRDVGTVSDQRGARTGQVLYAQPDWEPRVARALQA